MDAVRAPSSPIGDMFNDSLERRSTPPVSVPISSLCHGDPKLCGDKCGLDRPLSLWSGSCVEISSISTSTSPLSNTTAYSVITPSVSERDRTTLAGPFPAESGCLPLDLTSKDKDAESNATIPCNAAWARLHTHPNIDFADLTLLAEVVAGKDHLGVESNSGTEGSCANGSGDVGQRKRVVSVREKGVKDALALLDTVGPTARMESR